MNIGRGEINTPVKRGRGCLKTDRRRGRKRETDRQTDIQSLEQIIDIQRQREKVHRENRPDSDGVHDQTISVICLQKQRP